MASHVKDMIRRIRASKPYADWVQRNRAATCIRCGRTENVDLHHIETLYHSITDHYKFYGDWDETYTHILARHEADQVSAATLCDECHGRSHPGRQPRNFDTTTIDTSLWLAAPRTPIPRFAPRRAKHGHLGLLAFQTLLGIGNYILRGAMTERILTIPYGELARLLGKQNGTAWRDGLDGAATSLAEAAILSGHHMGPDGIELHIEPGYITQLIANPWFVHYRDGQGSNPLALFLRWLLSFLCNRKRYSIGIEKLAKQLNSDDTNPHRFAQRVAEAAKQTTWIRAAEAKDGLLHFQLRKHATAPVYPLRRILAQNAGTGK